MGSNRTAFLLLWLLATMPTMGSGHEFNDRLDIGLNLFASAQYGRFQHNLDEDGQPLADRWGQAAGLDLALDARPTPDDQLYLRGRYVRGNGLNDHWQGALAPWATDLHDDHVDINASGRNHLLEAWYRHRFALHDGRSLATTLGIIDASAWLDDNAYAADEMHHFMNDAFVARAYMPSYDWGAAAELDLGRLGLNAVYMNSKTGDSANRRFDYAGLQVHYHLRSPLGPGTYRLWSQVTSGDFLDPREQTPHSRLGAGLSIDQAVGEHLGIFVRTAWQRQRAAVNYRTAYTAGVRLAGSLWGRAQDEAGLALGHLPGGNLEIEHTLVLELYLRWRPWKRLDITADLQYMQDELRAGQPIRRALIPGLRLVAGF